MKFVDDDDDDDDDDVQVGITARTGSSVTTHSSHAPASQSADTVAPRRTIQVRKFARN